MQLVQRMVPTLVSSEGWGDHEHEPEESIVEIRHILLVQTLCTDVMMLLVCIRMHANSMILCLYMYVFGSTCSNL